MEKFDLENFPTSESAKKMLSYVSDGFYDDSYVAKWLFQVMGLEYDTAREIAESLPDQMFPETATWGLMYHEIKWGLPVRQNLKFEERRQLIYQKRDFKAPMTPYRMETFLQNTTGFEVHVEDIHDHSLYGFQPEHPNIFKATFIGEGTLDTKKALAMLLAIRQSHTTFIMNDRVIIVVDNTNLEEMILRNIKYRFTVPFWYCNVFDGSWQFDGSILMNAERRYDLKVGLKYDEGSVETIEDADIRTMSVKGKFNISETIESARAMLIRFVINFWNILYFDGSWKFDGSKKLNASRDNMKSRMQLHLQIETKKEEIGDVTVTTRRNLWLFDGSVKLDGSRLMNSINRKEEL